MTRYFPPVQNTNFSRGRSWRVAGSLLLAAVTTACSGGEGAAPGAGGPPGGAGGPGAMALPVGIATLEAKDLERASKYVATIRSRRSTTIQPQVEGFLTEIRVSSGDQVTPGTPLFEIDSTTQAAAVASLRSQRAAREADATFARQQAERQRMLLEVGATSQQEYEQAVAQAASTAAQLATLDEQIRQQEAELAYYHVVSPTAGVVGDVPVRVGDRVTRSTMLTTVEDNAGLEVYVQVPLQQAADLRVGLPVQVLDDAGRVVLTPRVSFVSASVDDATQTVLAKTRIDEQNARFRSEQFVRVRIIWSTEPTLTVPVVAISRIAGQHFAFAAVPGEGGGLLAQQRSVTLGAMVGSDYVLLGGFEAGEQIIVSGIQKIFDGMPVQPLPPPGAGGRGAPPAGGRGGGGSQ
jgi:RND family efflux transporter MFP subunit